MCVHVKNAIDAWNAWKTLKKIFDTQHESKWVDLQMKLLKQQFSKRGYVLEHISRLKILGKK
jgi:hypothetical protein